MMRALCFSLSLAASLATVRDAAGANWPQWRGPGRQAISTESQLPLDWAPGKNIIWTVALDPGHSSPIVWGDRIFVTAAVEGEIVPGAAMAPHSVGGTPWVHPDSVAADRKHTLKLLALDAKTGNIVWDRTAYEGTVSDARHRRGDLPRRGDRGGPVRGWAPAGSGAFHRVAGGVCRSDRDDERGRGYVPDQGRTSSRDRPHANARIYIRGARHLFALGSSGS